MTARVPSPPSFSRRFTFRRRHASAYSRGVRPTIRLKLRCMWYGLPPSRAASVASEGWPSTFARYTHARRIFSIHRSGGASSLGRQRRQALYPPRSAAAAEAKNATRRSEERRVGKESSARDTPEAGEE